MNTNPIITLSNSGFKIANKVWALPNTYSLTIQSNASGTASSDALIGTENYSTTLYAIPNEGYRLNSWNVTGGSVVDDKFIFGTSDASVEPVFAEVVIPVDMDFIYQAKDFDGTKIHNKALNSTFGDYLQYGSLIVNESGANCYLSNNHSDNNYLYKTLTNDELNNIKAIDTAYTWFIRVASNSGVGGIMSTRASGGYIYMIRSRNNLLEIHTSSGNIINGFTLAKEYVYKVVIKGSLFYAKNLVTGDEYSFTYSTNRSMGNEMRTFNAGYSGESNLDAFYAMAGIARETTAAEDEIIKNVLLEQSA